MENIRRAVDFFENSVKENPDRFFVSEPQSRWTYQETNKTARVIATKIAQVCPQNTAIPVFMEKSPLTVAAFLGIQMAGCSYVPITGEQPNQRVEKILTVLGAQRIVTDSEGRERLDQMGIQVEVMEITELADGEAEDALLAERKEKTRPDDTVYIMFTSGSTGSPKGVEISHRSVVDFITHFTEIFGFSQDERFGNQAPFDFDVSVKDIYSAAACGGELVLIPKEYFAIPPKLIDYICDRQITTLIWAVPALCIISSMKGFDYRIPHQLRRVMFSGQAMPVKQLLRWQEALPDARFVNLYGPTEITCNCTYYEIEKKFEPSEMLPLGKVFPGREVLILDEDQKRITETGKPGELYVTGESLAKGYYNNPEETERKFVTIDGKRAYRSGDMARLGEDGEMYFCGRCDFQIKHMGHRIELEEVEASIMSVEGVEACCCTYDKERQRMSAFYTGSRDKKELRVELKEKLPVYMIPNRFYAMEQLPFLKNGKIDRQKLAAM